jgi:GNAT superfamily N-acetyltransferase
MPAACQQHAPYDDALENQAALESTSGTQDRSILEHFHRGQRMAHFVVQSIVDSNAPVAFSTPSNIRPYHLTMNAPPAGIALTLDDGTPVLLRPVSPGDFDRLKRGVLAMSETSRYMRFFAHVERLTDDEARYFTNIDQVNHVAWCAVEPSEEQRGYGLARFVRDTPHAPTANFAVAVIDEMQGRGLGVMLLASIYLRARQVGVRELQGEMLPDNPIMPKLMARLGGRIVWTGDPTCRLIRWPIVENEKLPTDTMAGRRFVQWLGVLDENVR